VIRNLPALYGSQPDDPSARRIGSYLMWVAIATTCVTSSLFLTALAPNLLAIELASKTAQVSLTWTQWFVAFAPMGIALLILIPLMTCWIYRPEIKAGDEVPKWAGEELAKMGAFSPREIVLGGLVPLALGLSVFGGGAINATTVALLPVMLAVGTTIPGAALPRPRRRESKGAPRACAVPDRARPPPCRIARGGLASATRYDGDGWQRRSRAAARTRTDVAPWIHG
jgi:hypothetical protein